MGGKEGGFFLGGEGGGTAEISDSFLKNPGHRHFFEGMLCLMQ